MHIVCCLKIYLHQTMQMDVVFFLGMFQDNVIAIVSVLLSLLSDWVIVIMHLTSNHNWLHLWCNRPCLICTTKLLKTGTLLGLLVAVSMSIYLVKQPLSIFIVTEEISASYNVILSSLEHGRKCLVECFKTICALSLEKKIEMSKIDPTMVDHRMKGMITYSFEIFCRRLYKLTYFWE